MCSELSLELLPGVSGLKQLLDFELEVREERLLTSLLSPQLSQLIANSLVVPGLLLLLGYDRANDFGHSLSQVLLAHECEHSRIDLLLRDLLDRAGVLPQQHRQSSIREFGISFLVQNWVSLLVSFQDGDLLSQLGWTPLQLGRTGFGGCHRLLCSDGERLLICLLRVLHYRLK